MTASERLMLGAPSEHQLGCRAVPGCRTWLSRLVMEGGDTGCRARAWLEYVIGKQKGVGWLTWLTTLIPQRFGSPGLKMF